LIKSHAKMLGSGRHAIELERAAVAADRLENLYVTCVMSIM